MIGMREIMVAAETAALAGIEGIPLDEFMRRLELEPAAVRTFAAEAAREEFHTLPGLPANIKAQGRLDKAALTEEQAEPVRTALVDTALAFMVLGVLTERRRHGGDDAEGGRG